MDYRISGERLKGFADQARRLGKVSGELTPAQIQTGLESVILQEKTVTPTTEVQEVTPDNGYYGLSKVTVEAAESIPENARLYYVASANSEFSLNFTSSAVGAL